MPEAPEQFSDDKIDKKEEPKEKTKKRAKKIKE